MHWGKGSSCENFFSGAVVSIIDLDRHMLLFGILLTFGVTLNMKST